MLFFLSIAAKRKYVVDSYVDDAVGIMEKDSDGNISMTKVTLRPHVQFSGDKKPTMEQLEKMHHQAHEQCFIANSVKTQIVTEIGKYSSNTGNLSQDRKVLIKEIIKTKR